MADLVDVGAQGGDVRKDVAGPEADDFFVFRRGEHPVVPGHGERPRADQAGAEVGRFLVRRLVRGALAVGLDAVPAVDVEVVVGDVDLRGE